MGEHTFDYSLELHELRTHTTEWLVARRVELVSEQRRLRVEELAVTAVLDERGAMDDSFAAVDGVSIRSVRDTVATARALEELPCIAAAAHAGAMSEEQLKPTAIVADPESDAEWARRAPNIAPADLAQLARTARKPSLVEMEARRAAREHRMWWRKDAGMLDGRYSLHDIDGALVEQVFSTVAGEMRPAPGEPWASREHRMADALVAVCKHYAESQVAAGAIGWTMHVEVPLEGPATVAGIPIAEEVVESLYAQARIEPVLVDDKGGVLAVGRARATISAKQRRRILGRDRHCRILGCERCHGLEVHHLWPRSWGGTNEDVNLAAVCTGGTGHHPMLAPQGPYLLLGDPTKPDGLTLIHRDDLPALAALAAAEAAAHEAA